MLRPVSKLAFGTVAAISLLNPILTLLSLIQTVACRLSVNLFAAGSGRWDLT